MKILTSITVIATTLILASCNQSEPTTLGSKTDGLEKSRVAQVDQVYVKKCQR